MPARHPYRASGLVIDFMIYYRFIRLDVLAHVLDFAPFCP